jgi:hypothetical protein
MDPVNNANSRHATALLCGDVIHLSQTAWGLSQPSYDLTDTMTGVGVALLCVGIPASLIATNLSARRQSRKEMNSMKHLFQHNDMSAQADLHRPNAMTALICLFCLGWLLTPGAAKAQAPIVPIGISLNPNSVTSGNYCTGTVILSAAVDYNGRPMSVGAFSDSPQRKSAYTYVSLSSSNSAVASVPSQVVVPSNSATVSFTVTTQGSPIYTPRTSQGVPVDIPVRITAFLNNVSVTTTLVIKAPPFDFNHDLLFQDSGTGAVFDWSMNGLRFQGSHPLNITPLPGWQVVGSGDFDDDGQPDLVLQNQTSGNIVIWYLNGTTVRAGSATSIPPAAGYKVVGVSDFNYDGLPDLLFQNQSNGQLVVWYMDGSKVIGGGTLAAQPYPNYQVVGVGDFNGDGQSDIVLQHSVTNQIVVWYMKGTSLSGGGFTSLTPASGWKMKGIADYNNDGYPDLVFQNSGSHQVVVWFMNGLTFMGGGFISEPPPAHYQLVNGLTFRRGDFISEPPPPNYPLVDPR